MFLNFICFTKIILKIFTFVEKIIVITYYISASKFSVSYLLVIKFMFEDFSYRKKF